MDHLKKTWINILPEMLPILHETRKWALFIAIIGFVGIALLVIMAFSIGSLMDITQQPMPFPGYSFTVINLLLAVLYFFPVLYLYRFSVNLKKSLHSSSSDKLLVAFSNLKSHYKFIGILFIVMLAIYVLAFIMGIFGGAMIFQ